MLMFGDFTVMLEEKQIGVLLFPLPIKNNFCKDVGFRGP